MEKVKKKKSAFKIIMDVILYAVLAFMLIMLVLVLYTKKSGGDNRLFGYRMEQVLTGSMTGAIDKGEVFLAKKYTGIDSVKVGDIVTYKGTINGRGNANITHRIKEISEPDENGVIYVITRGDANSSDDAAFEESKITDIFVRKLPVMTFFFKMVKKPWGFGAFIMVPLFLLLLMEVVDFIRTYAKKDKEKLVTELEGQQAEQKALEEKIKKELLESINSSDKKD